MYADRLEQAATPSLKERLNRNSNLLRDSLRRRPVAGKRPRQDNWENDFYEDNKPQLSRSKAPRLDARDLRLKLQEKSTSQAPQNVGVRDLREMLSGSMHTQAVYSDLPKPKPKPKLKPKPQTKPVPETSKPARKSVINEAPLVVSRKVPASVAKKTSQQKAVSSLDGLLRSLGLEKYYIHFQAEEVDMTALEHMTDEDLKTMGLPMGPRKKILSAMK